MRRTAVFIVLVFLLIDVGLVAGAEVVEPISVFAIPARPSGQSEALKQIILPEPSVRDVVLPNASPKKAEAGLPFPKLKIRPSTKVAVSKVLASTKALPATPVVQNVENQTVSGTNAPTDSLTVKKPVTSAPVSKPAVKQTETVATVKTTAVPVKTPAPVKQVAKETVKPAKTAKPVVSPRAYIENSAHKDDSVSLAVASKPSAAIPQPSRGTIRTELAASVGQVASVLFPGKGWLYLGTGNVNDGVVYMQNAEQPEGERFSFRMDKNGQKLLQFQKQDLQHGTLERREVLVTVDGSNYGNNVADLNKASTPNVATSTSYQTRKVEAVPVKTQDLPVSYQNRSNADQAASTSGYAWQPDSTPAVKIDKVPNTPEGMLLAAKQREDAGLSSEAMAIYERIMKDAPGFQAMDEVWFKYARLLETKQDNLKLRDAYDLYIKLQREYPYSSFAQDARARISYLDRNFFRVK